MILDENTTSILNEQWHQKGKKRKVLKLPCGHGNIEITKPEDQIIYCNTCHKKFYLIWQQKPKIEEEK